MVIAALMTNRIGVDVAMIGGLTILMLFGVVSPAVATRGFSHQSIMMIGGLFVVAAGLQETGGMAAIAQRLLGRPKTIQGAQFRLMAPVAAISALMNNTPIVAMYLPIVSDWAKRLRVSPSKLFMPLSFAAILGGKCTLHRHGLEHRGHRALSPVPGRSRAACVAGRRLVPGSTSPHRPSSGASRRSVSPPRSRESPSSCSRPAGSSPSESRSMHSRSRPVGTRSSWRCRSTRPSWARRSKRPAFAICPGST